MNARHAARIALAGIAGVLSLSLSACGGSSVDSATVCKDAAKVTSQLEAVQGGGDGLAPASAASWRKLAAATAELADEAPDEIKGDLLIEQKWMSDVAADGDADASATTAAAGHRIGSYIAKHCGDGTGSDPSATSAGHDERPSSYGTASTTTVDDTSGEADDSSSSDENGDDLTTTTTDGTYDLYDSGSDATTTTTADDYDTSEDYDATGASYVTGGADRSECDVETGDGC